MFVILMCMLHKRKRNERKVRLLECWVVLRLKEKRLATYCFHLLPWMSLLLSSGKYLTLEDYEKQPGAKYSKITLMYTYAVWPVPVLRAIFVALAYMRRILISLRIYYSRNADNNLVKCARKPHIINASFEFTATSYLTVINWQSSFSSQVSILSVKAKMKRHCFKVRK